MPWQSLLHLRCEIDAQFLEVVGASSVFLGYAKGVPTKKSSSYRYVSKRFSHPVDVLTSTKDNQVYSKNYRRTIEGHQRLPSVVQHARATRRMKIPRTTHNPSNCINLVTPPSIMNTATAKFTMRLHSN